MKLVTRAATFTKFGKRLHKFQKPKRFRLHVTSRLIFSLCSSVKSPIFSLKKTLKNIPCANIQKLFLVGCVIELISSNWKRIASCADSYITDIFFGCKHVIMPPLFVECGRALSVAHVRPSVRACVRASFRSSII